MGVKIPSVHLTGTLGRRNNIHAEIFIAKTPYVLSIC
jgi:hypothetical protein